MTKIWPYFVKEGEPLQALVQRSLIHIHAVLGILPHYQSVRAAHGAAINENTTRTHCCSCAAILGLNARGTNHRYCANANENSGTKLKGGAFSLKDSCSMYLIIDQGAIAGPRRGYFFPHREARGFHRIQLTVYRSYGHRAGQL